MVTVVVPPATLFTRTPSPSYTFVALVAPLGYSRLYDKIVAADD